MEGAETVPKRTYRSPKAENRILVLLAVMYFAASSSSFIDGQSDWFYIVQAQVEVCVLSALAYAVCPHDTKAKSVLLSLLLYNTYVLLTDWAMPYVSLTQWVLEILLFSAFAVYQVTKRYDLPSDKYNSENVLLAFYKPKTLRDYFITLFGQTGASMSIMAGGNWYMFKRNRTTLVRLKVHKCKLCDYVLVDTGLKVTENRIQDLDLLIGQKARRPQSLFMRCRCVMVFKDFLDKQGDGWKPKGLDFLPSAYMLRRVNGSSKRHYKRRNYNNSER